jgi:hypothetical protein
MAASAALKVAAPRPMDATAIERELARLWRQEIEANQQAGAGEPPSRTLLHTLIIVAPDHAAADQARTIAAALSPRQPARTIVLELNTGAEDGLNAAAELVCVPQPKAKAMWPASRCLAAAAQAPAA